METAESAPVNVGGATSSSLFTFLLVALASTAVVTPFFVFGNASGHDIQFHLSSWMDVAGQWREGVFYPRWAEWANWGFGEPRFIFYPPVSWLLGAALSSVLAWSAVPGAYIWIALVVAGMSMWKLVREWLPGAQATTAAVFFAVNPYNLAIVYYRSDFAELLAAALLPLLLCAALHVLDGEWRSVLPLAAVFALIWLCNAPEGVIATYALGLLLLAGCLLRRSLRPLLLGVTATIAGLGLAAFYILPAARERNWVQISQALTANLRPEQNFLFTHSSDREFQLFNWKISSVAVGMMLVAAVAAVFAARRRRQLGEIWWMLIALGSAAAAVMFRPSALLWRYLPELAFLQFPWRWLGSLGIAFAFFVADAIGMLQKRSKWRLATGLMIAALASVGVLIGTSTWWNSDDASFLAGEIRSSHGYEGVDEYAPLGSDRYALPGATPDVTEVPAVPATPPVEIFDGVKLEPLSGVKLDIQQWSGEREHFTVEVRNPVTLALRLISYPAWEVQLDGRDVRTTAAPETAEMLVPVPAGEHQVDIRFRRTGDRTAGDAISILSAMALLGFRCIARRRTAAMAAGDA